MNRLLRWHKKLQRTVNCLVGIMMVLMMSVILAQTFTRYVVFYSLPWSEELSRYLFVAVVLLGINIGISEDMMVRINLIDNILSVRTAIIFEYVRDAVALVVSSVFCYSTIGMIQIGRFQRSPAMRISMSFMYGILFVGFLFAVFAAGMRIVERVRRSPETEGVV